MKCFNQGSCFEPDLFGGCYWNMDGFDSFPMSCVGWYKASAFCQWIGGSLPSEAQWEYAARSEGKDITYPWGDEAPSCDYAVFNEGGAGCGTGMAFEVCSKPAGNTDQGLCDMAGNLLEWVQDTHHSTYEGAPTDGSAWEGGTTRRTRGSSFKSNPGEIRSTGRGPYFPQDSYTNTFLGFRCVRDVQ